LSEPQPDDCFMFSYTSGTTGDPKGVKLTHKMIITMASSLSHRISHGIEPFNESDIYMCYLPSSHSFEQGIFGISIIYGMAVGFFSGDPIKMIQEDLPALQPTVFPSVPRLYNRIYGKLKDRIGEATGIKKMLVDHAISTKMENLKATGAVTSGCWDAIVFKKMKALLGGRVRLMATGSAPLSGEVIDFLKICFCCELVEGYGLTETCAGSCAQFPGDKNSGYVGGPVANVKVKLRDIPEMNYLSSSKPPRGEICFWGPAVMSGYFKNEEKTAEAFEGGWFKTGDVGEVAENGAIRIIDRAKNIFKLSQGEYIAPEKLENVYV
jgi:long-chain acyl-CoA synthetase